MEFINTIIDFLSRNEGTILGAILSGLVALFAFFLGIKFQHRKERKIYTGNLFSLLTELEWKKGTLERLVKELNTIKNESAAQGRIVTNHSSTNINLENLFQIRDNIIKFEFANSQILLLINVIINLSIEINPSLDFTRPIEYLDSLNDEEAEQKKPEAINGYFDNLISGHIKKLELALNHLSDVIKPEIHKYPDSEALKEYSI